MSNKAKVYFLKLDQLENIKDLAPEFKGTLGLKCHFGEKGNDAFVPAEYVKKISGLFGYPNLIETSVLYRGPRSEARSHIELAREHGFNFAEIDILDGAVGDDNHAVELPDLKKTCYLGAHLADYNSLLVSSHFKGHGIAGFGGAVKNLAMGLASRRGKLAMHAGVKHQVDPGICTACGTCIANCPVNAIAFGDNSKAVIDQEICISCSKCISVCPVEAIHIPFGSLSTEEFQARLAEYALAAVTGRQCFYVNFLINIVPQCDCMGAKQARLTDDIGVLASGDPIAIDQASFDLVTEQYPQFKAHDGEGQLNHGEMIGLGTRGYQLERI